MKTGKIPAMTKEVPESPAPRPTDQAILRTIADTSYYWSTSDSLLVPRYLRELQIPSLVILGERRI